VLILAVTTGLRIGELLALQIDDVDLPRGIIKIQRSVSRDRLMSQRQKAVPVKSRYLRC